ncbi:zinc finger MYM-type protein 1-like [Chenopodium quinoa]|uniref:zinc finger MYM-type protein 1-like n=1 Tax=Chenopodium quinoa TaxID=63459 RepID=UPI000B7978D2|nr:zinc finger MYM-type protein 1-like [Chenopodium quinoa]
MDKFIIRKKDRADEGTSGSTPKSSKPVPNCDEQVDLENLPIDPAERTRISDYPSKFQEADRLDFHVGDIESSHSKAVEKYLNLKNVHASIETIFNPLQTPQMKNDYKTRLNTSIVCVRYLLRMGLAFRGHDESDESSNRGNFIELVKVAAVLNGEIDKVVLNNAPKNLQMTAPSIQKDIVHACAKETTKAIIEELGGDLFGILVDESSDVSVKEQLVVVLRFVNKSGLVVERFLGLMHVPNTCAISLKSAIESLLLENGLSMTSVRGQDYDGASNMRGEFGGLKTLVLNENRSAYYVHCFSHQLQLTLVGTSKNHVDVIWFFDVVSDILNVVGSSCKKQDILREKRAMRVAEQINNGEIETGKGLNQELGLKRLGETRWGSHYKSLLNLIELYPYVIDVLDFIYSDASFSGHRKNARGLMVSLHSFDFAFILHLMFDILGITNELSLALQTEDQDIINAMDLVGASKQRHQLMRDDEFEDLLEKVNQFCYGHDIDVPNMNDFYMTPGRPKRNAPKITYEHHYRVEVFYATIDLQLQELNNRFNEINTELLRCVACLCPKNSFHNFDVVKLVRMAELYPYDFDSNDIRGISSELRNFIIDVRQRDEFQGKYVIYPSVNILIKLALLLPVATASVERAFSAMKYVKSELRNKMGDHFLNDCLVAYIERDICETISNETVMYHFQNMKPRRGQLP